MKGPEPSSKTDAAGVALYVSCTHDDLRCNPIPLRRTEEKIHSLERHIHWKLDPSEEIKPTLQDIFPGPGFEEVESANWYLLPICCFLKDKWA